MQVHIFIAFLTSTMLHEPRTTSFNLDTASSFLLDVLDICSSVADNLSTEIESRDWLKINRNLLFRPLALFTSLVNAITRHIEYILYQTHLSQLHLALCGEIGVRLPNLGVPVSLVPQSSRLLHRGPSWLYW